MNILIVILFIVMAYQLVVLVFSKKARQQLAAQFKLPYDVFYEGENRLKRN